MSILGRFLQPGALEQRTLMSSAFVPPPQVGVIDDFVGVHRAMAHMTVFACVRLLADTIASLPWKAYRRDSQGVPKPLAVQPQLVTQPMQGFSLFEWKWMVVASMALRGNSYHYVVERDRRGYPQQILPLHPDIVFLERRPDILMWFDPIYRIMGEAVPSVDMIHMRRFTMPGEPWGMSPIRQAAVAIGLGLSAEEFGYRFYKESATPSGTLQTDQDVDADSLRLIQQNWISSHGGRRLPAVLSKGFKFEPISIAPDEAQFLECVLPGTLVTMANGTRKPAEQLCVGDEVASWDGSKLVAAKVKGMGTPPIKPIVKITTRRGRELICTADHPVLAQKLRLRSNGRPYRMSGESDIWVHAGDLQPGQRVRVALGRAVDETLHLPANVAYFLGCMVGDGRIHNGKSGGSLTWSHDQDRGAIDRMTDIVASLGGELRPRNGHPYECAVTTGGNSGAGSLIRAIVNESELVGCHSYEKFVPDMVIAGGPVAWRQFLSGYFDADGCMQEAKSSHNPAQASWTSTSRELLEGCQHLLALLGINSSIYIAREPRKEFRFPNGFYDTRREYRLNVSGGSELSKLAAELDLGHSKKRIKLENHLGSENNIKNRSAQFEFDLIKSVCLMGDGQAIGVEIENTHTFVTNGIITHNTRQFQRSEICLLYGVPPILIGDTKETTAWGCLPGNAQVFTTSGPVPIKNVKQGDEVWSYDGERIVKAKVTGWVMTGYKPLLTIKTRGRQLRLTSNHHIPVRRYMGRAEGRRPGSCGWETFQVDAGDVRVGDYLIVPHGMGDGTGRCTPDGQELTVGMMEFAGLYLGDGCRGSYNNNQIIICHGHGRDADHLAHYRRVIEREFGKVPSTDASGTQTRFSSCGAITLLDSGFAGVASTKRIPDWVFQLAPELQLALLRGYLDADGSVQHGTITYSSVNKELLEDARHLCIQLGIPVGKVTLGRKAGPMTIRGKTYQSNNKWVLSLTSLRYNIRIGSNSPHKSERLDRSGMEGRQRRFRYDPDWTGVSYGNRKPIGLPPADSVYHKVVSIEHSDIEVPVYDIEVAGPAHYVADGVVVGNTGVEQITLGAVTYTFRPWTSLIEDHMSAQLPRGQFVRFDYNALLRGDMTNRFAALKEAIQGSFMTPNEVRAGEEMDPLDNGDELLAPPGFVPLGTPPAAMSSGGGGVAPPAPKSKKTPQRLPSPSIGGGEMGGGNGGNGSRGVKEDPFAVYEQELRVASHDHGKSNGDES